VKTPILGSSYVARSINAADNRLVNLFPEAIPDGGKEAGFLNRAPGLQFLQTVGTGPIRGLWAHQTNGSDFYVVSGSQVFRLAATNGTPELIGTVSGTGPVSIADNGAVIFFACNGPSYTYFEPTGAFDQITDVNFPGAVTVAYIDNLFVFNEPNSQRIWSVDTVDPVTATYIYPLVFNSLYFSSADGSPDGVVAINVDHRQMWVFGTDSVEVWYNAGLANFPLTPVQGAFNEIGCVAPYSIAKLDNALFWLGTDARGQGIVYKNNGYSGVRVSTHAIEYAIAQYGNISDAVAYTYQQEGHAFYVLNFPSASKTWVYDVSVQAWHERASGDENQYRHRSNCQCNFGGTIIVGDFANGNIYSFDLDVYADNGQVQKWLRSWRALPTGQNNLKRTAHHSLQLDAETGVGLNGVDPSTPLTNLLAESYFTPLLLVESYDTPILVTETGDAIDTESSVELLATLLGATDDMLTESSEDILATLLGATDDLLTESGEDILVTVTTTQGVLPQAMLRWSDDGGHTWSNEHWRSMGAIGQYGYRTIWRRLGMTEKLRDRVYEVSGTDPVKIAIMGAELFITPTNA